MKIQKLLITAAGIGAIVGLLTPQISNAAVTIPHPDINISRPTIPTVKPIVSIVKPTIAMTGSHATSALSNKAETGVKLNPKNEGLVPESKNKPAKGGVVALTNHNLGGTSYNPDTNTTTTYVWRPERDIGGGMKEKAHWEKIVETGDTTGNHNGKF